MSFIKKAKQVIDDTTSHSLAMVDRAGYYINELGTDTLSFFQKMDIKQLVSAVQTDTQYDTTHYFLIPQLDNPERFILHTIREVPEQVADLNGLKKRKMFHTPSTAHIDHLYELAIIQRKGKISNKSTYKIHGAEMLSSVADSIDQSNQILSNGLLFAGSIALLINPITGIAILGASLFPDALSTLSNFGSQKLKHYVDKEKDENAYAMALEEFKNIKPTVVHNSILAKFYRALKDPSYCALLDPDDLPDILTITAQAIKPAYANNIFKTTGLMSSTPVHQSNVVNYYRSLAL
jgi:hypothetical protein